MMPGLVLLVSLDLMPGLLERPAPPKFKAKNLPPGAYLPKSLKPKTQNFRFHTVIKVKLRDDPGLFMKSLGPHSVSGC